MSGFSIEWEKAYAEGTHLSRWPWSDVVSLTIRTLGADLKGKKVLEIGCGYGANIPFFLNLNAIYFAVDGSATAIQALATRFPELQRRLAVSDFTQSLHFDEKFDLILDRAAVTHNTQAGIQKTLALAQARLKPGGVYLGVDWFADDHSEANGGEAVAGDPHTRTGFTQGPFAHLGAVHFSSRQHLIELFHEFDLVYLERKKSQTLIPHHENVLSAWNLMARPKVKRQP